jgi:hypothetical protein
MDFEPKSLPWTSKRNTNTAPSKEEVNNLISLISGTKKKHIRPFAILEPEERNVIEERLKQFQNGRWKVLLSEGFDYQTDIYTCVIQSRKWFDFLEAYPSCKIVLKDETISALKWQPYVWDIIIKNDRLKKYLAKRSVATIREGRYEWVSPFTNGMKVVFDTFWAWISQEKKDLFIHAMEGRAGNALNVSLDEGVPLIDALVYEWWYAQVDLRYSRPQVISAAEFLHYKTELGM